MILKSDHSPGRPLENGGEQGRLGAGSRSGGQMTMRCWRRRPPQGQRQCSHVPPLASSVRIRSSLSLGNTPSVDVPLTFKILLLRPVMCFAGWLPASAIFLFPLLAPLPSLTSSLWTPLPLPWDLFPVRQPHLGPSS